jgi:hypothetical protein
MLRGVWSLVRWYVLLVENYGTSAFQMVLVADETEVC